MQLCITRRICVVMRTLRWLAPGRRRGLRTHQMTPPEIWLPRTRFAATCGVVAAVALGDAAWRFAK